jgi:hypothetical protein
MREGAILDHLRKSLADKAGRVPDAGRLVWSWFLALCRTRTSNGYGPNPISYAEIEAYARLYRWPLEPRHVDLILAMDRVWMEHARGMEGVMPGAASRSGVEMTPEAFDAVFG